MNKKAISQIINLIKTRGIIKWLHQDKMHRYNPCRFY